MPADQCGIRRLPLILEGREVGEPALPALVGCTARIATWDMPQLGVLNVRALGEQRFRVIDHRTEKNGLTRAEVELLAPEQDAELPPRLALGAQLLRRVIESQPEQIWSNRPIDTIPATG